MKLSSLGKTKSLLEQKLNLTSQIHHIQRELVKMKWQDNGAYAKTSEQVANKMG